MNKRFEKSVLIGFAVLAVGLGFWGYAIAGSGYIGDPGAPNVPFNIRYAHSLYTDNRTWSEAARCFFSSLGLIRLVDLFQPGWAPWQLVVAQVLVPGIALVSAAQLFLVGVRKNLRTAMARRKTNHTIVCGIGAVGMQVIQNLRAEGRHLVAIDLRDDSPSAATCEKSGVPVLQGDAKNPQVLLAAGIRRAQTAIVSTGSDGENMDIALQIKSLYSEPSYFKAGRIQVLAELRNDWMHKRLMASDKGSLSSADVDLRLFNPFNSAARLLIKRLHLPPAPEFEARTFVLIGFGSYGRETALHLVRSSPVALGATLKILVFDEKAEEESERFLISYPAAAPSLEFVNATVAAGSPDLAKIVGPKLEAAGPLLGVAIALGDDQVTLSAALEMRLLLDRNGFLHTPVYVRLEYYRRLGELVRDMESVSCFGDRLQIFGTLEETLSPDLLLGSKLDAFAQALHEDFLRRSQDSIKPEANVSFRELPEFLKMSNRWRADHTPLLMELAGIHVVRDVPSPVVAELNPEQVELLAQLEHRRYTMERGLVESRYGFAYRENPHLVQWDELSEDYKNWNREEIARLPKIMAGLGMELHAVRTFRLYGKGLKAAEQELEQFLAAPGSEHCSLIVNFDDPEAVHAAQGALSLPSLSLWLFSDAEPREFFEHKLRDKTNERNMLIRRANGWAPRERVRLET